MSAPDNTIFLYGPPASGKTTLGRRLASALKTAFVDLDAVIVDRAGRSIPEIFAAEGEESFRNRESEALAMIAASQPGAVIALGGGTLLRAENRALCERSGVIWCLEAPSDAELARRIGSVPGSRPLGNRAKERASHYASFPNRIAAFFEAGESLVIVGSSLAAAVLPRFPAVVDENVTRLHFDRFSSTHSSTSSTLLHGSKSLPLFILPSGERHKTIDTVASIWSFCSRAGIGRQDVVCACGGGVTGDLTGFAAATWMRGIDWVNVPTTLLAMVDASTGGKTGCDLPEGKNLAGAFHAPRLVVIDTDFLLTLPAERLADGRAEMIKHEIVGQDIRSRSTIVGQDIRSRSTIVGQDIRSRSTIVGQDIRSRSTIVVSSPNEKNSTVSPVTCHLSPLPSAAEIAENLMVKVDIVREDPLETKGRRLLLNCGHTVGHAVEKASEYRFSHGEAVAIGCVAEARLAVKLGLAKPGWPDELASVFAAAELPTELPEGMTFESLKSIMRGDKKRAGDTVTFALPCNWGDVRAIPVDLAEEKLT